MKAEIGKFRATVTRHATPPKPYDAPASLVEYTILKEREARPPYVQNRWFNTVVSYADGNSYIDRRELRGRLWVAHAAKLPIHNQVGALTLISSGLSDYYLEQYLDFGEKPDGTPAITLQRSITDDRTLRKIHNWVATPSPNADFVEAFPIAAHDAIEQALSRAGFTKPDVA